MARSLLAAFLALVACSGRAPAPAGEPGRPITSLAEVAGPWDIARFDGYEPMRLHEGVRRAFVNISPKGLSYAIECNYSGSEAMLDQNGVLHEVNDGLRISTAMACGPVGEPRESAFFGFFASAPKLAWAPGGRLRLANGKTELLLERPEVRRLAHVPPQSELAGPWVPQGTTRLLEGGGYHGWGFQTPSLLTFSADRIAFSGCGRPVFTYRYAPEGRLLTEGQAEPSACGMDSPALFLVQVLADDPLVERIAGGGMALTAGDRVVTLRREGPMPEPPPGPPPPPAPPRPPR